VRSPENDGEYRALVRQRRLAAATAPLWLPLVIAAMRWGLGWKLSGVERVRAVADAVYRSGRVPLLVCANHLTMVDSAVIAWALGTPATLLRHFHRLPWNVPERRNFAASLWARVAVYLAKCVPVTRGAPRQVVAAVLGRLAWLLGNGESVLVFPEGGRSRSGRVDVDAAAYGVGRLLGEVPEARVLCVYVRGRGQQGWSDLPRRGETFEVRAREVDTGVEGRGLRAARDRSRRILECLAAMEREHFEAPGRGDRESSPPKLG
jgi:1-acyl-sn-glycerol-3-phosphate acyltransferase